MGEINWGFTIDQWIGIALLFIAILTLIYMIWWNSKKDKKEKMKKRKQSNKVNETCEVKIKDMEFQNGNQVKVKPALITPSQPKTTKTIRLMGEKETELKHLEKLFEILLERKRVLEEGLAVFTKGTEPVDKTIALRDTIKTIKETEHKIKNLKNS